MTSRLWLVIPAMGIVAATIAFARDAAPVMAASLGMAGAAIAAAGRGLRRDESPADVVAAIVAATVAAFGIVALRGDELDTIAIAAAGFAIVELARGRKSDARGHAAVFAAFIAASLDVRFAALAPLAAISLVANR